MGEVMHVWRQEVYGTALSSQFVMNLKLLKKIKPRGFPGSAVVKNPPANSGDTGSSPGPGRSHVPWSN